MLAHGTVDFTCHYTRLAAMLRKRHNCCTACCKQVKSLNTVYIEIKILPRVRSWSLCGWVWLGVLSTQPQHLLTCHDHRSIYLQNNHVWTQCRLLKFISCGHHIHTAKSQTVRVTSCREDWAEQIYNNLIDEALKAKTHFTTSGSGTMHTTLWPDNHISIWYTLVEPRTSDMYQQMTSTTYDARNTLAS